MIQIKALCPSLLIFASIACATDVNFYVAPSGKDFNPGTKLEPVQTLTAAKHLVRRYKSVNDLPQGGITVWVAEGEYYQSEPFVLNENDSGTAEAPITWRGVDREKVSLTGGIQIPTGVFKKVANTKTKERLSEEAITKVVVADLKSLGITNYGSHQQYGHALSVCPAPLELFFKEKPMTLARYPNNGFVQIEEVIDGGSVPRRRDYSGRGAIIKYSDERHSVWAENDDIWLQGTFGNGYADDKIHVEYIDPVTKTLKLSTPHMYGVKGGKHYTQYVALNILEELDNPGEWYMDRKSGMLYFWPPEKMEEGDVAISILEDPIVCLEGASHLTFRDFTVETGRGIGIYLERGEHNTIAGCTVRNLGTSGIWMGQGAKQTVDYITHDDYDGVPVSRRIGNYPGHIYKYTTWDRQAGKNHKILSCDVYNTGTGGILLSGGSKRKLIPGKNIVENCKVHDYNRRNKFRWGGVVVDGCGNKVRHCEIFNSDFQAIFTAGPEHTFEYNNIHHVTLHSNDTSIWYMGRDPSDRGIMVRYNYIHDSGNPEHMNMGIYCDDSSTGITVFGNIFNNIYTSYGVLYSNTGWDLVMENNIVINPLTNTAVLSQHYYSWAIPHKDDTFKLFNKRLLNDINIKEPPYSEKYPDLVNYMDTIEGTNDKEGMRSRRNILKNNVVVGANKPLVFIGETDPPGVFEAMNNLEMDGDPGFVDYEGGNLTLRKDSEVYKLLPDFEPIPFDKIGLYEDEYRKL